MDADRTDDTSTSAPTCLFCDRPSGTVSYVWPDWLCRMVMERHGDWTREGEERQIDLVTLGRMEREVDTTVTRVCDTCAHGWIQRLEDNVRPVLESMIAGETTPLPPVRRKLLARWAAKTAVVMESTADDTPVSTPRFAREHLRKVGIHPGTQVLAGRYEGRLQILSHERDLFSTTIDGEKRYASQTSFVIGRLLLQVFAAPWQDTVPELTESAAEPFIPLVGIHDRDVVWPPPVSIDDSHYDQVRRGSDAPAPPHRDPDVPQGRGTTMTTDDFVDTDGAPTDVSEPIDPDSAEVGSGPERSWHSAAVVPEAVPDIAPEIAPVIAPRAHRATFDGPEPAAPEVAAAAPNGARRRTSRRRLAGGVLMLVVLGALFAWGLHQRSEANQLRSRVIALQVRAHTREVQLRNRTLQFRASQATIGKLNRNISALASDTTTPSDRPEQLRQIIGAIPAVSDGVRHCANISLATVSDALDFVATYPKSTTDTINTDSSKVETTCGQATAAINTLEGLTAGATSGETSTTSTTSP